MRTIQKTVIRFFLRNPLFVVSSILCVVVSFFVPLTVPYGNNFFRCLEKGFQINVFSFLFFSFLSCELSKQLTDDPDSEALRAIDGVKRKTTIACFMIMFSLLAFITLLQFLAFSCRVPESRAGWNVYVHVIKAVILYGTLPGCIGITAGVAFSKETRTRAYIIILLFTILFSPTFSNILPESPVGILTKIDEWIRIFTFRESPRVDSIYGIPMETSRWVLGFFWMFVFLTFRFMNGVWQRGRLQKIGFVVCFVMTVICGFRFHLRENDSVYDTVSAHGMLYSDIDYYEHWFVDGKNANCNVAEYDLSFIVKDNLQGKAVIKLNKNTLTDRELFFTLYHGLEVTSVLDAQDHLLPFVQEGDYLTITTNQICDELIFTYSGKIERHFSNRQGVFLPGYTAYYPIPGHIPLWNRNEQCIQPIINQDNKLFKVSVDSTLSIVSNIEQIGRNVFQGYSCSLTLIGGFIKSYETETLKTYYPLLEDDALDYQLSELKEKFREYAELLNISKPMDNIDTVFVLPYVVQIDSPLEEAVFIDGCLIHANPYSFIDYDYLAVTLILQDVNIDDVVYPLYNLFKRCLRNPEPFEALPSSVPDYDLLLPLFQADSEQSDIDLSTWVTATNAFRDLFSFRLSEMGKEKFFSAVYTYLTATNRTEHPVDFLYSLHQ